MKTKVTETLTLGAFTSIINYEWVKKYDLAIERRPDGIFLIYNKRRGKTCQA